MTQWLSAAVGGYIAGRMRTRWIGTHGHEVFFRDTAHGFVTWALATAVIAVCLASSVTTLIGGGTRALMGAAQGAAQVAAQGTAQGASWASNTTYLYGIDTLLRPATPSTVPAAGPDLRPEIGHILAAAFAGNGSVSDADRAYLANLVASRTGVTPEEAQRRVTDFINAANDANRQVKAAADAARSAAAKAALFTALALVIGAFIACVTAALGGRLRDEHP